jgi:hypothetical protein
MPRRLPAAPFLLGLHAVAHAPEDSRPCLVFRENWNKKLASSRVDWVEVYGKPVKR